MRMIVIGRPLQFGEIEGVKLATPPCFKDQVIKIHRLYVSDEMPDDLMDAPPLLDALGQWKLKDWDGKVLSRRECTHRLHRLLAEAERFNYAYANPEWDRYGGWTKRTFEKTGWFRTHHDGRRWWLVDPDGHAFLSTGIDCVRPGEEARVDLFPEICDFIPTEDGKYAESITYDKGQKFVNYGILNLIEAFGEDHWFEAWSKIVKMYLYQWNVNTIADWSSLKFIRWANMPYVIQLDSTCEQDFPKTEKTIFRDFPDVFSEEYEQKSETYAAALHEFKDDPYLIGYFMRNEPNWSFLAGEVNIAELMLANGDRLASKQVFIQRMRQKYGSVVRFNKTWNLALNAFDELNKPILNAASLSTEAKEDLKAFTAELIERFVAVPAMACRKVDPNHLNLGMRYPFIQDPVVLSGHQHMDVFSINSYQMDATEQVNFCGEVVQKPIVIGEFQFGAMDKGHTASGIRAVENQRERGVAYRYYMERACDTTYAIGAHYFILNDQSPIGRFDGENYQIGMLDVCMQEYAEMTEQVASCNSQLYRIAAGEEEPTSLQSKAVPPIF
jgi:hypothetical protein